MHDRIALGFAACAFLPALPASAVELRGSALVLAPPAAVETLPSPLSLPVAAVPVGAGAPVEEHAILVVLDVAKVQRQLDARQRELLEIQKERRWRASNRDVERRSSARAFEGPPNQTEANLAQREQDAMRDLTDLQGKLAASRLRAPSRGYVVEQLLVVGGEAKRRKPAIEFVPLARTRLQVTVDPAPAQEFAPGTDVLVVSAADGGRRFQARVDSLVTTSESTAVYSLVPLELPFLALSQAAEVIVTASEVAAPPA